MAITNAQAKRALVLSMTGTLAVVVIARVARGKMPEPRIFIALGFVYVVIAALTDASPQVATPLAALVFFGALLTVGGDALGAFNRSLKRPWKSAPEKPTTDPFATGILSSDPNAPPVLTETPAGATETLGRMVELPKDVTNGRGIKLHEAVYSEAVALSRKFNVPITSGYRSRVMNQKVDGKPKSDHLCGFAADYGGFSYTNRQKLLNYARQKGYAWVQDEFDHVHVSFRRCPA